MGELVKLAEVREVRAKEEMARLLEARAEVYHGGEGGSQPEGQAQAGAEGAAALGQPGVCVQHWLCQL